MGKRYKYKLSILRDLGWQHWDPIGLKDDRASCDDEYDSYLLQVVSKLTNDVPRKEIVDYLVDIEQNYIGLGVTASIRSRAENLVTAIADYQGTLTEA
jgi:hypothetical protein